MVDADLLLKRLAAKNGVPMRDHEPPASRYFVTHDGLRLHVLDWAGAGPPVIFLHGGALTAHSWDLVCSALRDIHRCVCLDLRGHGLSDWSDRYPIAASVADVASLIRHMGFDACHVVGMSLGGIVAAHYAVADDACAASLVLVDMAPGLDFSSTANMRSFMGRSLSGMSVDGLADEALKVRATADRDMLLYRYVHMTRTLPDGTLRWRHDDRRPFDFPHIFEKLDQLEALAPDIRCPVLIIRGERSRALTDAHAARFASLLDDGSWAVVPDAGHIVQEDNPVVLAEAIGTFLSRRSV